MGMTKRLFIFLIIIVALALLSIFWPQLTGKSISNSNQDYQKEPAIVTRVVDGDTIHVKINGEEETIRLLGINTPEHDQPYYQEAKDFLKNIIENKSVELERDLTDTDKYDRKLRYVFYKDDLVNVDLVQQGFAPTFMLDGLKYIDKFNAAQDYAIKNNLRLWQKSTEECSDCIKLEKLDPNKEFFIINNSCNNHCNLEGWFAKDDANHFFYLTNMNSGEKKEYDSKEAVD
jgi:micrococcal nuclease